MTRLDDDQIADRLRLTFTRAADHAPRVLPQPSGAKSRTARTSARRGPAVALVAAVLIPAAFITLHALRTPPPPPASTTTVSATPTGHPPSVPDMAARASFGEPITVYNMTGTAKARITVTTPTRLNGTYLSVVVTIDVVSGTWTPGDYQMRLDHTTTSGSTTTFEHYAPDTTIDIGTGTRLPMDTLDAGQSATGQVTFTAPPDDNDFVLGICPTGPQCYDLALWSERP